MRCGLRLLKVFHHVTKNDQESFSRQFKSIKIKRGQFKKKALADYLPRLVSRLVVAVGTSSKTLGQSTWFLLGHCIQDVHLNQLIEAKKRKDIPFDLESFSLFESICAPSYRP